MKTTNNLFIPIFIFLLLINCSGGSSEKKESAAPPPKSMVEEEPAAPADPMDNKGVGPIKNVELGEIDMAMVEEGKQIYQTMCTLCHKPDQKHIGPALKGVLSRRSPEWIMNMILNPEVMVKEDPMAKQLLADFNNLPMANQNLTEEQARKVLEYFRTLE